MSQSVTCPECGETVEIGKDTIIGEIITCSGCELDLEVVSLGPIALELAPEEEEDWGE